MTDEPLNGTVPEILLPTMSMNVNYPDMCWICWLTVCGSDHICSDSCLQNKVYKQILLKATEFPCM